MHTLYNIYKNHPIITTDSRNCPQGSIFFALKGDNFNGNLFALSALEKGCAYAVVDEEMIAGESVRDNKRLILVDDVLSSLQQLAHHHRQQLSIPIIGITGTNGKTTTKEIVAAVLQKKFRVHFTQGNLNNHIGVPLTLLSISDADEIAVVEMGANHPGEIELLANIACPTHGMITNVGKAHLEGFGSLEGVIKTKRELYDNLLTNSGHIFLNSGNELLVSALAASINELEITPEKDKITRYAADNSAADSCNSSGNSNINSSGNYCGKLISCAPYVSFEWYNCSCCPKYPVNTHFIGAYNLDNMMAAIAIGNHFGIAVQLLNEAIAEYRPNNNRSQLTTTESNTIIVDAYNANPTSMRAAIDNFKIMDSDHKVAILGDMLELGEQSPAEHQAIADILANCDFETIILVGNQFSQTSNKFIVFSNRTEVEAYLQSNPLADKTILLKGSNGIGLYNLVKIL